MTLATRLSSATALAALALVAGAASASAGVDPTLNNPDNWENGGQYVCSKVEYADGLKSFTKASGVAFYVVKAGREVTVTGGGAGSGYDTYTSPKDISFIITCVPSGGGYPPS
ncbi:hypothetical protein [Oryzobacter terrae]|uniref:hypothetical protein n=1 Tax=Oryzobacter terrae TaxID=1620385 RepID=UPI00366FA7F7